MYFQSKLLTWLILNVMSIIYIWNFILSIIIWIFIRSYNIIIIRFFCCLSNIRFCCYLILKVLSFFNWFFLNFIGIIYIWNFIHSNIIWIFIRCYNIVIIRFFSCLSNIRFWCYLILIMFLFSLWDWFKSLLWCLFYFIFCFIYFLFYLFT